MTAENKSSKINYLTISLIETVYSTLQKRFQEIGEPIPPWEMVNKHQVENLVLIPQQTFSNTDLYPTLESKAAILFYKINKGHIFPNGNKRLSLACLFIFLGINGKRLSIDEESATRKAIELANSDPRDFENVKNGLESWIKENLENS